MSKDRHYKENTRQYSIEYKEWRRSVLNRDGNRCVKCGSLKKLHAHHIQSWRNFPEKRFLVENGETLCYECHIEIHPFMINYEKKKKERKIAKYLKNKQRRENKKNKRKNLSSHKSYKTYQGKKQKSQYESYRFNEDNPNPNWTS